MPQKLPSLQDLRTIENKISQRIEQHYVTSNPGGVYR